MILTDNKFVSFETHNSLTFLLVGSLYVYSPLFKIFKISLAATHFSRYSLMTSLEHLWSDLTTLHILSEVGLCFWPRTLRTASRIHLNHCSVDWSDSFILVEHYDYYLLIMYLILKLKNKIILGPLHFWPEAPFFYKLW